MYSFSNTSVKCLNTAPMLIGLAKVLNRISPHITHKFINCTTTVQTWICCSSKRINFHYACCCFPLHHHYVSCCRIGKIGAVFYWEPAKFMHCKKLCCWSYRNLFNPSSASISWSLSNPQFLKRKSFMSNNKIDSHESFHIALLLFESLTEKFWALVRSPAHNIDENISLQRREKKIAKTTRERIWVWSWNRIKNFQWLNNETS